MVACAISTLGNQMPIKTTFILTYIVDKDIFQFTLSSIEVIRFSHTFANTISDVIRVKNDYVTNCTASILLCLLKMVLCF